MVLLVRACFQKKSRFNGTVVEFVFPQETEPKEGIYDFSEWDFQSGSNWLRSTNGHSWKSNNASGDYQTEKRRLWTWITRNFVRFITHALFFNETGGILQSTKSGVVHVTKCRSWLGTFLVPEKLTSAINPNLIQWLKDPSIVQQFINKVISNVRFSTTNH